jgi:hypothetical protein
VLGRTTLLTVVLATATLALATPGIANAGPADDAAAGLRTDHLYVAPQTTTRLDAAAVRAAIGDAPIRIAILPAGAGVSTVRQWPRMISAQLPGNTVAVIAGRYFYAGSDMLARGAAGLAATHAIARHKDALRENASSDLTAALLDFVAEVKAAPLAAGRDARGGRYAADEPGGGAGAAVGTDDTGRTWLPVAGGAALALLLAGGGAVAVRRRAGRRSRAARTEVTALLSRLSGELGRDRIGGSDGMAAGAVEGSRRAAAAGAAVEAAGAAGESVGEPYGVAGTGGVTGSYGGGGTGAADAAARAMADAAARHATAGALLAGATTDRQFAAARHLLLEGLTAARAARRLRGEPAGAPVPPFDLELLDPAPDRRRRPDPPAAGARELRAAAEYAPQHPYFHAGRFGVPTGWYPVRIPATGAFAVPAEMPAEPTGTSHGTR